LPHSPGLDVGSKIQALSESVDSQRLVAGSSKECAHVR